MLKDPYEGISLSCDPIHGYIRFTSPRNTGEITEEKLIDNPWVQRLRRIHQLQSAFWVYPSAEHSRFQHALGAMHIAGRFAKHIYKTLKEENQDCPSSNYVEELMRISGLVHDIGHGPFSHFFDENYLEVLWSVNHETIGKKIIVEKLGDIIKSIKRSPTGDYEETIDPQYTAFLIERPRSGGSSNSYPQWLKILKSLFCNGIYTVDNLDFVLRDAYITGFSKDPFDLERILHYTFVTEEGLTCHSYGLPALLRFIRTRIDLFNSIYYHRTTRAIDYSLGEVFYETMQELCPKNPIDDLDRYLELTEWNLFNTVSQWKKKSKKKLKSLAQKWDNILHRNIKWVTAYEKTFPLDVSGPNAGIVSQFFSKDEANIRTLEDRIKDRLPTGKRKVDFIIDIASQDPRPDNPIDSSLVIYIFDSSSRQIRKATQFDLSKEVPGKIITFRAFARNHDNDKVIATAIDNFLSSTTPSHTSNV